MIYQGKLHVLRSTACAAILLAGSPLAGVTSAAVIDFNSIPDGTPVSANNPYAGILNLQGEASALILTPPNDVTPIVSEAVISGQAPFRMAGDNVLQALPAFVGGAFQYTSTIQATFLQPAIGVSFDAYAFRTAGYTYTATNSSGDLFNGSGIILGDLESGGAVMWQEIDLSVPDGYSVTGFEVSNGDPSPFSAGIWLDNIAFAAVPEPSSAILAMTGQALLGVKAWKRRSVR